MTQSTPHERATQAVRNNALWCDAVCRAHGRPNPWTASGSTGARCRAGISNIFVPPGDGERLRAGCVAAAQDAFPGLPLVGYESGQDLAAMRALGFEATGPLRVWLRQEAAT